MVSVSQIVMLILIAFLVGLLLGFLSAGYFHSRYCDLDEDDDLGYLDKININNEVSKNEMCS